MNKFFIFLFFISSFLISEQIKEIANVVGVRDNQVIGYGLVVGLKGTGDGGSSKFTLRALSNLLSSVNVRIDPADIKSKNIAAVIVTTKLPAFAKQGDTLDVSISSIGDAKSLEGGTLLMTPLKAVDGNIYAISQGEVTIGGRNTGEGKTTHSTNGKIFNGAIVEREVKFDLYNKKEITLSLKDANFKTAIAIQKKLNSMYETKDVAIALDSRTIKISKPLNLSMIEFLSDVLDTNVKYEKKQKIIINEKTGTIVAGVDIVVDPVIITHGDITIKIDNKNYKRDDKKSLYIGDNVSIGVDTNTLHMHKKSVNISNITRSLSKLGAKPKDIISIIQAMKKAGAIRAELEII